MKRAIIFSIVFHVVILGAIFLGFGEFMRFQSQQSPALIVDFQAVGTKSTAKRLSPVNEKKADRIKKKDPLKPSESTPPPTEQTAAVPMPKPAAPKPEETSPQKKITKSKEDQLPQPLSKKKPAPKKSAAKETKVSQSNVKSQTQTKAQPKKSSQPSPMINLQKQKLTDKSKSIDRKAKSAESALDSMMDGLDDVSGAEEAAAPAESVGDTLMVNEVQAVVSTLSKCWFIQAGTQGVLDTPVYMTLHMNEDGTVQRAIIEDQKRLKNDPVFRTAAESAMRAALDPMCNPLPLSPKRYRTWKTLYLDFNPRTMAGISGGIKE